MLTSAHNNLHFTIEGTLKWFGGTSDSTCSAEVMITISGASGIVVDGAGTGPRLITSNYTVCQDWDPAPGSVLACDPQVCTNPSGAPIRIVDAFRVTAGSNNITIDNLNASHIGWMVDCPSASQVHTIHLKNLNAQNLGGYCAYVGDGHHITVENCHVTNAYGQHGFRFSADDVTILNSSATNTHSSGFWWVVGQNLTVDGFTSTGDRTQIGPLPFGGSESDRALNADVRNVDISGTDPCCDQLMTVNLGTIGAWFDNITSEFNTVINLGTVGIERPLNKVYWGTLNTAPEPAL